MRLVLAAVLMCTSIPPAFGQSTPPAEPAILPRPVKVEGLAGEFDVSAKTMVVCEDRTELKPVAEFLAAVLSQALGATIEVAAQASGPSIALTTQGAQEELGEEGYELSVSEKGVQLRAAAARGLFLGVQTFRQLLPPTAAAVASAPAAPIVIKLPALRIVDQPRFRWRGMLLDCGRHFMPKDLIKRYIDLMAYHKLNVLHWHLTDDQGWRIEIKKYPKLTEIGGWRTATRDSEQPRDAQNRYGGFYTQDDVREIVAYANSRFVTIVPEIEMPGHARAALAAHPELSCTGGPFKVRTEWGVDDDIFCAGSDKTLEFLENVLGEIVELFPGEYVHIGGDEAPKARWNKCPMCQRRIKSENLKDEQELQSYFVRRIENYLNARKKRVIGWDEILEGGLAPNATVQSWRGLDGAIAAAASGHDVVCSPTSHCYLDYAQGPGVDEPHLMGFIPLERCYQFEPTPPQLAAEQVKHILGLEGNLWTEHAPPALADRQLFPRIIALAEVAWTPMERRDWSDFQRRLGEHRLRLDALGVRHYLQPPSFATTSAAASSAAGQFELSSLTPASGVVAILDQPQKLIIKSDAGGEIRYTQNGDPPAAESAKYAGPLEIADSMLIRARNFQSTGNASPMSELRFVKTKALEPVQMKSPLAGVLVDVYKGNWQKIPDFAALTPASSAKVGGDEKPPITELAGTDVDSNYGLRFRAFLKAPREGLYAFVLRSDDGSRLTIGDALVADNDGPHGTRDVVGYAWLKAGYHVLRVDYFQGIGGRKLELLMAEPGAAPAPLSGSSLFVEAP